MSRADGSQPGLACAMAARRLLTGLSAAVLLWLASLPLAAAAVLELQPVSVALRTDDGRALAAQPRLPLHWDAHARGAAGRGTVVFVLPRPTAQVNYALFIPRVGNVFRIELDGRPLLALGRDGDARADYSKQPRFVPISAQQLHGLGRLVVRFEAQPNRKAGLSTLHFGPADEVHAIYRSYARLRVDGTFVVVVASTVLGSLALLLWLRQRERLYLYYGGGELLWALALGDMLVEPTPLPWPWWGVLVYAAQATAGMLVCKFALVVVECHHGAPARLVDTVLWLSPPLVGLALLGRMPALELLVLASTQAAALAVAVVVVRHGWRAPALEQRVMAWSMLVLGLVVLRDAYVLILRPYAGIFGSWGNHYGAVPWTRYAWLLFGVALAWIVAERLRRATRQLAAAHEEALQRLAEQQAQLNASFGIELEAKRRQARQEERQRVMRDMHDGLGSQLLGALQLAQDEHVPRPELVRQLRDALDQLKLTIDALHDTGGDVAALLGALRYRLEPRLKAGGLALHWEADVLPEMEDWSAEHALDLQMVLFEAFSNLLAHARARRATLSARVEDGTLVIRLSDDGVGLRGSRAAAQRAGGRGLANMQLRVMRLGGQLMVDEPAAGGTCACLRLPLRGPRGEARATS